MVREPALGIEESFDLSIMLVASSIQPQVDWALSQNGSPAFGAGG